RPERIAKAIDAGPDAVIVDLEDAVAPADKPAALDSLRAGWDGHAARAQARGVALLVRVNAADTPWHDADLAACRALGVAHVVVPKAADVDALARVRAAVPGASLYPLIESAEGYAHLPAVAGAAGVAR